MYIYIYVYISIHIYARLCQPMDQMITSRCAQHSWRWALSTTQAVVPKKTKKPRAAKTNWGVFCYTV